MTFQVEAGLFNRRSPSALRQTIPLCKTELCVQLNYMVCRPQTAVCAFLLFVFVFGLLFFFSLGGGGSMTALLTNTDLSRIFITKLYNLWKIAENCKDSSS